MLYASATQVAAVVPWGITGPTARVTLSYQGQTSVTATVPVYPSAPGLFTLDGSGAGQAAAINQDGAVNSPSNPAPAGSVISLYATGGGQTSPGGVDGQVSGFPLATQLQPVQVYVEQNLLSATQLLYAGPAPGQIAGLMQINVLLPPGLKSGSAVPISLLGAPLSIGQANATIAVR